MYVRRKNVWSVKPDRYFMINPFSRVVSKLKASEQLNLNLQSQSLPEPASVHPNQVQTLHKHPERFDIVPQILHCSSQIYGIFVNSIVCLTIINNCLVLFDQKYHATIIYLNIFLFFNLFLVYIQCVTKKRSLRHCSTHYGSIFKNLYIFEIFVTFPID